MALGEDAVVGSHRPDRPLVAWRTGSLAVGYIAEVPSKHQQHTTYHLPLSFSLRDATPHDPVCVRMQISLPVSMMIIQPHARSSHGLSQIFAKALGAPLSDAELRALAACACAHFASALPLCHAARVISGFPHFLSASLSPSHLLWRWSSDPLPYGSCVFPAPPTRASARWNGSTPWWRRTASSTLSPSSSPAPAAARRAGCAPLARLSYSINDSASTRPTLHSPLEA